MAQHSMSGPSPREITGRTVLFALLAFFGVIISVNVVMARFAVSTFGGVETDSSYKAGLLFRGEEEAAAQQGRRHWSVDAQVRDLGGGGRMIILSARDADGQPLTGLTTAVRLSHPTDARKDVPVPLADLGAGRYSATLDAPAGQWLMVIDLSQGGERLFRSRNKVQLQ